MQILSSMRKYILNAVGRYSLEEIISADIEKTRKEKEQCQQVIRNHRFLQHIAKRRLEALLEWTAKEELMREEHSFPAISQPVDKKEVYCTKEMNKAMKENKQ
jgi:hypothetical protein